LNRFRVCVYAICKNESKFVEPWMASMGEADLVVVTDTGSTDDTVDRLRRLGAVVYEEEIRPWRFDTARNRSLEHVPENIDICVCTDLDERFLPGWREKLESAWRSSQLLRGLSAARTGRYLYNWSLKPDGTPAVQFYYFKVHERNGFRWKCPIHEYVQYAGTEPLETVYIEGMVLNHYPDSTKPRDFYLPLLELAVEEDPTDDRMRCYLGREYTSRGEWRKSIDTLQAYLALPSANWDEERSAAMRWIANAFYRLGEVKEAYHWYGRACEETPRVREPYVEFAALCYELEDWPMVLFLTEEALKLREKSKTFVNLSYAWDGTADDLCAVAAYRMHLPECALEHARRALAYQPDSKRLQNNLILIESAASGEG